MLLLIEKVKRKWKKNGKVFNLMLGLLLYTLIIEVLFNPLTKFIDTVEHKARESNYRVTVVIPQFIPKKGWHNILHNQSSILIRAILLFRRDVVITTVPFHLKK